MSDSIDRARERLSPRQRRANLWITLAAAGFAAAASLVLAAMVILGPGLKDRGFAQSRHAVSVSR